MKLKDARDNYYFYSGKTSDIIRQIGLAGIGVIWLFKTGTAGNEKVPVTLSFPLILIVLGLALDLTQYAVATGAWGWFQRFKELSGTDEDTAFVAPRVINVPTILFFMAKIICIIWAYVLLLKFIALTLF